MLNLIRIFIVVLHMLAFSCTAFLQAQDAKHPVEDANQKKTKISSEERSGYYGWSPLVTAAQDSQDTSLAGFKKFVGSRFGKSSVRKIENNMNLQAKPEMLPGYLEGKLRSFYSAADKSGLRLPSMNAFFDNKFNGVESSALYLAPANGHQQFITTTGVSNTIALMDIPFNTKFFHSTAVDQRFEGNMFSMDFDKEKFNETLKNRMSKHYDLKKYFLKDLNVSSYAKSYFANEMKGAADRSQSFSDGSLHEMVGSRLSTDELINLDDQQLQEKLLPADQKKNMKERIIAYENALQDTTAKRSPAERDSMATNMNALAAQLNSFENFLTEVGVTRKKLKEDGFDMDKFARLQNASAGSTDTLLNKPEIFNSTSENLLSLNGIQKIFLKLKTLKAGSFNSDVSEGTVSNYFMNGTNLSLFNNGNFMAAGAGSSRDGGYAKDVGLNSSIAQPKTAMQFLRLGKGDLQSPHSHLTLLNANAVSGTNNGFSSSSVARNIFAGTLSRKMNVGQSGSLEAELSKSSTQFKNTVSSNNLDALGERKSAIPAFGADLWETMAFRVNYTNDFEHLGLSPEAHFDLSGMGYNNPGSPFGSRGTVRYGVQVRKELNDRRISILAKSDFRRINNSADGSSKWNNGQFQLNGRFKINRASTVGMKFHRFQMVKVTADSKMPVYFSNKVTTESQNLYSIGKISQRTNLSVGLQQFTNRYGSQSLVSKMLVTTWVQAMPLSGGKMLSQSTFYNKELTKQIFIGDLLSSDVTLSYPLKMGINLSSGITYLDNKSQARQLGVKQGINALLLRKVDLNVYADYRKNLITPVNPYLFSEFRGEVSLAYNLK